ncbi:hypothetical protein CON64_17590 [Bacillus pseudomycoides]|nr:hypothetical protein CON64_17590 [Bacillus pseudomycoides]
MNIQTNGNELITKLLNDWYQEMRAQQVLKATQLKKKIDSHMSELPEQNQDLLLHYSLLDFRYKLLTNDLGIGKDSFDRIEALDAPSDHALSYYYHFFKAVHATMFTSHTVAREHFEKAEVLLKHISDELEHAEFNYRYSLFLHHTHQELAVLNYVTKAKEIFLKYNGYESRVALCENVYGMTCIHLRQFEKAEESFASAINILQKKNEKELILRVRNNIGWLYSTQNLSNLAIRHLSEVNEKIPNHFKAIFLEAKEHYKLENVKTANELIEKGLNICNALKNEEYIHHFTILSEMCKGSSLEDLENAILAGFSCFHREGLLEYVQEYGEILAVKYYSEGNDSKSAQYFYRTFEAKQNLLNKGALK